MDNPLAIALLALSVLQISLRHGSAVNSQSPLAPLLKKSQKCLIVGYIPSETAVSEPWAQHLAQLAVKTITPMAFYTATGAPNKTEELQLGVNCKLFLVYVEAAAAPSACEQLWTSKIPLASDLATENEQFVFIALDDISSCMESALLVEQDMDHIGYIAHVRPFVIFLQLAFDPKCWDLAIETAIAYEFKVAYEFKLFCASSWSCFLRLSLSSWWTFAKDRANLHLWDVIFYIRRTPAYNQEDLVALASAPLHKLRIGVGLNPSQAVGAPFMKLALILAANYNFTAVAFGKRQHFRPVAPFRQTPAMDRRSFVQAAQIVRVYSKGWTRITAVPPMIRTFLYCQQRRKWAVKSSGDALAFVSRLDGWTWLFIALQLAIIGIIRTKLFERKNSIMTLLAPLMSQGLGSRIRRDPRASYSMVILWSLGSIFLSSCYMGGFESLLVTPTTDDSIKTFKDLIGRDYRILVKNRTRTYGMLMDHPEANTFSSLPHLRKMKETADVIPNSEFGMHMHLVEKPKRALFDEEKLLRKFRALLQEYFPALECFVGTENLFLYPRFWLFYYPYSSEFKRTFELIVESGIYKLMNEIYELQDMNCEMLVRESYVRELGTPVTRQSNVSATSSVALFSMENPQANIIFKGCAILLGMAALGFMLEVAVKALANAAYVFGFRISFRCFEIRFY